MKTLVKIAFLSAAALTIAGIAHADHRDYRIALANQDKYGPVSYTHLTLPTTSRV